MSELEDRINSVLNDPAQMEKIAGLARSLMGGEGNADAVGGFSGLTDALSGIQGGFSGVPDIDPAIIKRVSTLMSSGEGGNDKRALLEAMRPYLSEKRRQKMDKALQIARIARIARIAMGEDGGEHV